MSWKPPAAAEDVDGKLHPAGQNALAKPRMSDEARSCWRDFERMAYIYRGMGFLYIYIYVERERERELERQRPYEQ